MFTPSFLTILIAAAATAAPLYPRQTRLDPEATAEAQRRDNTATRAFSDATIRVRDEFIFQPGLRRLTCHCLP